jgi:hypothetical protein
VVIGITSPSLPGVVHCRGQVHHPGGFCRARVRRRRVGGGLGQRLIQYGRDSVSRTDPSQPQRAMHGQQPGPSGIAQPPGGFAAASRRGDCQIGVTEMTGDGCTDQTRFG